MHHHHHHTAEAVKILGERDSVVDAVLTPEAIVFLEKLHRHFNGRRLDLLQQRQERQQKIDQGEKPEFLKNSAAKKDLEWRVAATPPDLQRRWVEITGPTNKKMVINALNSGADVFMADFEDANSPTWRNLIEGQHNLIEAVRGTLTFSQPGGKHYALNEQTAVLFARPRGWHLNEKHFLVDDQPISGSLFDFGLYFFHNAQALIQKGSGPYFYLPKMENHHEAKLWNDVFIFAQDALKIPQGTIRATVLLETILAAFEMEEILFELRDHSAGLNAGRWDYIFSTIKKFRSWKDFVFPDRSEITMTVPFMRAYTQLLVKTCHKRGAHAMGGMAAFIPSRTDKEINEKAIAKVREDKLRESGDGFDGTWVAHPDLVGICRQIFEEALQNKPNQKEKPLSKEDIAAEQLISFEIPNAEITEEGMRKNINIALQYLCAWLAGIGAVGIFNLMEDAATAEISRAQLWQWVHHKKMTPEQYRQFANEEEAKVKHMLSADDSHQKLPEARQLLDKLVLDDNFEEFLTLPAYKLLNNHHKLS